MPEPLEPYVRLLGAFLLALPTAWHRERNSSIMGLRTFPLVSIGCCAFVLIGLEIGAAGNADATARLIQGILTGIGFVGGGAILKRSDHVTGTASAASIWITGAIGTACAFGLWGYAIVLSVVNLSVFAVLGRMKPIANSDHSKHDD